MIKKEAATEAPYSCGLSSPCSHRLVFGSDIGPSDPVIPLPKLDIVAVDELPCGGVVVRAIKLYRPQEMAVIANDINSIIARLRPLPLEAITKTVSAGPVPDSNSEIPEHILIGWPISGKNNCGARIAARPGWLACLRATTPTCQPSTPSRLASRSFTPHMAPTSDAGPATFRLNHRLVFPVPCFVLSSST
jgi:hypothetical protein